MLLGGASVCRIALVEVEPGCQATEFSTTGIVFQPSESCVLQLPRKRSTSQNGGADFASGPSKMQVLAQKHSFLGH